MLVSFFGNLDKYQQVDLSISNLPQLVAGCRHVHGDELAEILLKNEHIYILQKGDELISIHPQMALSNFDDYHSIMIVPKIEGDTGVEEIALLIIAAISAGGIEGAIIGAIIEAVIDVAIALAIGAVVQLITPTHSFKSDPAIAQSKKGQSSLFNGAPNIREQGGSVPMCFGTCHAGGVLISAGVTTEEKTV